MKMEKKEQTGGKYGEKMPNLIKMSERYRFSETKWNSVISAIVL